jgi:transposase-like protein
MFQIADSGNAQDILANAVCRLRIAARAQSVAYVSIIQLIVVYRALLDHSLDHRNGVQMKPEQLEIARLKREVIKLKAERDILKKAAAYFAKEST